MRLHPRTLPVQSARSAFIDAMWSFMDDHGLTYAEMVSILAEAQAKVAKYMIRVERHGPDSDKKGDEE